MGRELRVTNGTGVPQLAKILVVDDELLVRYSMRMVLETAGYQVDEAESGEEAADLMAAKSYDLLIVDIVMPRKGGVETILDARTQFPNLPILAISGGGPAGRLDRLDAARRFGADAALTKPFTEDRITRCVERLLKREDGPAGDSRQFGT